MKPEYKLILKYGEDAIDLKLSFKEYKEAERAQKVLSTIYNLPHKVIIIKNNKEI